MRYGVTTYEEELHTYYYEVEADSEEQANDIVASGTADWVWKKHISGEVVNVEVEGIK